MIFLNQLAGIKIISMHQDIYIGASYYTEASLHKSGPRFQYIYTHHQGSEKPQKFPQRNQFLDVFCSLPLCYKHAQNLQAQQPPYIDHQKKTE